MPIRNSMATPAAGARSTRACVLAVLLALAPGAFAQPPTAKLPIEQQMTTEQFKAAGLHQLNREQLANLNAWLNGTIEAEVSKAKVTAKKQVEEENRGFFNFGSADPIVARISGDFRGFNNHRSYTLDNGQVWQQTEAATLVGVRLSNPEVRITPSRVGNAWYMQVKGYSTRAKVQRVK
jgi:hypothetical protein